MKVLMLDIDGVLNKYGFTSDTSTIGGMESEKISLLNEFLDKTEYQIVISSSWGLTQDLINELVKGGFKHIDRLVGQTTFRFSTRGEQIKDFCERHPRIKEIIILEDEPIDINGELAPQDIREYFKNTRIYQPNAYVGLTREIVDRMLNDNDSV